MYNKELAMSKEKGVYKTERRNRDRTGTGNTIPTYYLYQKFLKSSTLRAIIMILLGELLGIILFKGVVNLGIILYCSGGGQS